MNENIKLINWKLLILCVALCLGGGFLSGLTSQNTLGIYESLNLPDLYPPGYLFSIVWTILYILMGISLYMVLNSPMKRDILTLGVFGIQLVLNFAWTPVFFVMSNYLAAFILLVIIWVFAALMIYFFYKADKKSGLLQIPYLVWLTFAAYLSYSVYVLN